MQMSELKSGVWLNLPIQWKEPSQSISEKGCDLICLPLLVEYSLIALWGGGSSVWFFIWSPQEYLINAYDVSGTILEASKPDKALVLMDLDFYLGE